MKKKTISVIIPCYNEEKNVDNIYFELDKVSKELDAILEIIFIDDGSYDLTLKYIKKLAKKDKRVRYLSFSRNLATVCP